MYLIPRLDSLVFCWWTANLLILPMTWLIRFEFRGMQLLASSSFCCMGIRESSSPPSPHPSIASEIDRAFFMVDSTTALIPDLILFALELQDCSNWNSASVSWALHFLASARSGQLSSGSPHRWPVCHVLVGLGASDQNCLENEKLR